MLLVNKNPSPSVLRNFGWTMLGGFAVLGLLFWFFALARAPWYQPTSGWGWNGSGRHLASLTFLGVGLAFALVCAGPSGLAKPLYVTWMTGAMIIGAVMSTILLTILFCVLLPVFSLIRFKDPLRLKLKAEGSYWEDPSPHEATLDRTLRQF